MPLAIVSNWYSVKKLHEWINYRIISNHLKGTKAISSVTVFKPNLWPKKDDNFKEMITKIIVVRYASHDSRVKRFFRFQNFVVSGGYLV